MGTSIYQRFVHVRQSWKKQVPFPLMIRDIVSKSREDCSAKPLRCPNVYGWWTVVVRWNRPSQLLVELTTLITKCSPLSVSKQAHKSIGTIQWSGNKFAVYSDILLDVEMSGVDLIYQSIITRTCWFPFVVFDNGPSISMTIITSSAVWETWTFERRRRTSYISSRLIWNPDSWVIFTVALEFRSFSSAKLVFFVWRNG